MCLSDSIRFSLMLKVLLRLSSWALGVTRFICLCGIVATRFFINSICCCLSWFISFCFKSSYINCHSMFICWSFYKVGKLLIWGRESVLCVFSNYDPWSPSFINYWIYGLSCWYVYRDISWSCLILIYYCA